MTDSFMLRSVYLIPGLCLLAVVSLLIAVSAGSVFIDLDSLFDALWGTGTSLHYSIIWELRIPRAGTAFVVGGLLALAGTQMQVLLRNPLADPYILGVSGGAAVFALLAMMVGLTANWISLAAALGALLSISIVFGLAHGHGTWSSTRLLLTGVVVAAGWGAIISFILAVSPNSTLRGMLFWLMGDLRDTGPPLWSMVVLAAGLMISLSQARSINMLAYGDLQAQALGVSVGPLRLLLYFLASILTATAVSLAGSVGFVGLVVPHILRLLSGGDHRTLLFAATLLGGSLVVLADTLARTVIAPQQLPVGVVTAFIGVPVFLFLLYRGSKVYSA
ncbi:FecCD family ABC transporter permease [Pseudomonadota bacterium]